MHLHRRTSCNKYVSCCRLPAALADRRLISCQEPAPQSITVQGNAGSAPASRRQQFRAKGFRTTKGICYGILDSYRQSQVVPAKPKIPEYNALVFESADEDGVMEDEDICPAECVEEVSSPADFKARCEVWHHQHPVMNC